MSQQSTVSTHSCDRCEIIGRYILANNSTVRTTAACFSLSKSTIHKDVTTKLKHINPPLYAAVREVLEKNKAERHLRGGDATRVKYLSKKSSSN